MEENMVNKLKCIMDYQRIFPNSRLKAMIDNVEQRYTAISDADLFFVAAAGEPYRTDDEMNIEI